MSLARYDRRTRPLNRPYSESEDPASCNRYEAVGARVSRCDATIHACCRAQVHQGPEEHECSRRVPLCGLQAEGDEELHAYRLLGPTPGAIVSL